MKVLGFDVLKQIELRRMQPAVDRSKMNQEVMRAAVVKLSPFRHYTLTDPVDNETLDVTLQQLTEIFKGEYDLSREEWVDIILLTPSHERAVGKAESLFIVSRIR